MDPAHVWLKDDIDEKAYFPDDNGRFIDLDSLHSLTTLDVEGPEHRPSAATASTSSVVDCTRIAPPSFKSVVKKSAVTHRIKVMAASW